MFCVKSIPYCNRIGSHLSIYTATSVTVEEIAMANKTTVKRVGKS